MEPEICSPELIERKLFFKGREEDKRKLNMNCTQSNSCRFWDLKRFIVHNYKQKSANLPILNCFCYPSYKFFVALIKQCLA